MNFGACAILPLLAHQGSWFRAMAPAYATKRSALAYSHTSTRPNRFNEGVGAFSTLYLSEDHMVALFEVEALFGSPYDTWVPVPNRNWTILSVSAVLQSIVDLTQASAQAHLATTAQELTGDWRGYRLRSPATSVNQPTGVPAPTQELGAALYATVGVEGFLTISAKVPTRRNQSSFLTSFYQGAVWSAATTKENCSIKFHLDVEKSDRPERTAGLAPLAAHNRHAWEPLFSADTANYFRRLFHRALRPFF